VCVYVYIYLSIYIRIPTEARNTKTEQKK